MILVALSAFVAAPLYRTAHDPRTGRSMEAEARAESLIRALREVELDRESGLLGEDEYERQRGALEAEAARMPRPEEGD